jgi:hypothetical protein
MATCKKRRGLWLPLVIIGLAQESMATKGIDNERATVGISADIPRRLGADREIDQVASAVRGVGDLMGDPRVGRTGNAVSGADLVNTIAVAEQTLPFEHDEDLVGHKVRMRRARAVARRNPPGIHAETAHSKASGPPHHSSQASTRAGNASRRPALRLRFPAPCTC